MKKKERKNYLSNYDPPHKPAPAHTHTYGGKIMGFCGLQDLLCLDFFIFFMINTVYAGTFMEIITVLN